MKIGVIGAGASGIVFAINRKMLFPKDEVIVFEHLDKPLKKILATGNGKCNIANTVDISDQYNEPIIKSILKEYKYNVQKEFLEKINIKTKLVGNLAYPISESAVTVRNALLKACDKYGVKIELESSPIDYQLSGDIITLFTNKGEFKLDKLVFATAGKSSPNLGSDGSIVPLLEKHGYKLIEFRPVLCPIYTRNRTKEVDGTRFKGKVSVYDDDEKLIFEELGEVLFKDRGLSGIVIFNSTRYMKDEKPYRIRLDLLPDVSKEELKDFLKKNGRESLLEAYLHPNLAKYILKSDPNDKELIDHHLKAMTFIYDKAYGFEVSQVSAGGIRFKNVDAYLESKSEKGIYFIGELLDYDGPCGGYNLMWAIATGLHVSKNIK